MDLVDEALGLIDTSKESSITSYDIYYKGDMEKWLKLGKSLKLRLLLYLANHEDVARRSPRSSPRTRCSLRMPTRLHSPTSTRRATITPTTPFTKYIRT